MKEGDKFEIKYTVTPEIYQAYIKFFDDRNPLHTNEAFAKEKGFSAVVMHGGILTGFLSNFIGEQLPLKNVIIQSYKIAFAKPVYLNTVLQFKAMVTGVFESVNCVVFKYSFENESTVVSKGEISIGII
ncbi:MaoC/PaaZ C-terminal domain-containing protein [Ferruginibacter sp. SUN106]|uniref:MaoC/PaaZ C-terminal domain-containing protein n=1 Tax=Ferruginibacter sp. SUN106 TaxID=2978348 RepID=UPI003D3667DD